MNDTPSGRKRPPPRRNPPKDNVDPAVKEFAELLGNRTYKDIERLSGVSMASISNWTSRSRQPGIMNFRAVLNSMGYDLKIVPIQGDVKISFD